MEPYPNYDDPNYNGWAFRLINVSAGESLYAPPVIGFNAYVKRRAVDQMKIWLTVPRWQIFSCPTDAIWASKHKRLRFLGHSDCTLLIPIRSINSPLIALPLELILEIVDWLTIVDIVYLYATSAFFLRLLGPRVQRSFARNNRNWMGHHFIFLDRNETRIPKSLGMICGKRAYWKRQRKTSNPLWLPYDSNLRDQDFREANPPYMEHEPTPTDLGESTAMANGLGGNEVNGYELDGDGTAENDDIGDDLYEDELDENELDNTQASYDQSPVERGWQNLGYCFARQVELGEKEMADAWRLINFINQRTVDEHYCAIAILRNRTTRQYVREDVLAQSKYPYGLTDAILTNTQWSTRRQGELNKHGPWAGHSFDIATMADIRINGQEWSDIAPKAYARLWDMDLEEAEWTDATEQVIESFKKAGLPPVDETRDWPQPSWSTRVRVEERILFKDWSEARTEIR